LAHPSLNLKRGDFKRIFGIFFLEKPYAKYHLLPKEVKESVSKLVVDNFEEYSKRLPTSSRSYI